MSITLVNNYSFPAKSNINFSISVFMAGLRISWCNFNAPMDLSGHYLLTFLCLPCCCLNIFPPAKHTLMRPQNELLNDQQKEEKPGWGSKKKIERPGEGTENIVAAIVSCLVSRFSCYCLAFTLLYFTLLCLHSLPNKGAMAFLLGHENVRQRQTLLHPGAERNGARLIQR